MKRWLACLALAYASSAASAGEPVDPCPAVQLPSAKRIKIKYLTQTFSDPGGSVSLSASFPQVSGSIFPEGESQFNRAMAELFEEEKAFQREQATLRKSGEGPASEADSDNSCVARAVNGRFVDVQCTTRADGFGAHSYWSSDHYTVDLRDGHRLTLRGLGVAPEKLRALMRDHCGSDDPPSPEDEAVADQAADECNAAPICLMNQAEDDEGDLTGEEPEPTDGSHCKVDGNDRNVILGRRGVTVSQMIDWYSYCATECEPTPDFTYEQLQALLPADSPLKPYVDMMVSKAKHSQPPRNPGISPKRPPK